MRCSKAIVRKKILDLRNQMSIHDRMEKSKRIFRRVFELEEFIEYSLLMAYVDFGSEVMTREFIGMCLDSGRRVALPVIVSKGTERYMVACEVKDIESELKTGAYGIPEPCIETAGILDAADLEMIVVPGIAFGKNMHRIGYGKGYYDRFLSGLSGQNCIKTGVGFDIQLLDCIPFETHDMPLDIIVTENETVRG